MHPLCLYSPMHPEFVMPSRVLYLQAEKAFGQWMASNKKDGFKSNSSKAAMTDLSTSYLSSQVAEGVCDLRD